MNYFMMFLFFLLPIYIADSMAAYLAYLLAGRRMPYKRVFAWQVPAALIQAAAFLAISPIDVSSGISLTHYLLRAFFNIYETVIRMSWVYFLFRDTDKKKRFFYVSAIYPFTLIASFATNALVIIMSADFVGQDFGETAFTAKMVAQYAAPFLIVNGCVAAIMRLVSGTGFWSKLQAFGSYPKLYMPMGIIYFLVYTLFFTFGLRFSSVFHYIAGMSISYIALLVVAVLIVSDIKKSENLAATQGLLAQQQSYIHMLESIQREIRSIQHDYKNMLSGLYASASEGNAEAVKEYIDTKLLKVDETVRDDLRLMNQLTRIEIPELRGLVMTKMMEAESAGVRFKPEAMFPVKRISMPAEDLLRCIGILLDNAIEEAKKLENAEVSLLLLQEDAALTIIVRNPVKAKPDLVRIWNGGYSDKGAARGVGLSNYKNIIRKYPAVVQETKIDGEDFVQILVLPGT